MGNHQSRSYIPNTLQQFQSSTEFPMSLSGDSISELNQFIGNNDGVLGRGQLFSQTCQNIMAQNVYGDIRITCSAQKRDGSWVDAALTLSQIA